GHSYGETAELPTGVEVYRIPRAEVEPGLYRNTTGTEALAFGLIAGGLLAEVPLTFASYPITPASSLLHSLAQYKEFDVVTFQAEDEIAAVCAAIGASFGGTLGVTSSSGPGIALKGEAIALACATELPLIVVNTQRGGPSTGMPTKTEQSDLNQALFGRHADTPMPVISTATPGDCFEVAIEAVRLATKFSTPVMLLSDGYLANAAEPWKVPDLEQFEKFPVKFETNPDGFEPANRDPETLARVWAKPGTKGLEHRIGGIERDFVTGDISYDPDNHQKMTDVRKAKVEGISQHIPKQSVSQGNESGKLAVVGWGSTYGAIRQAVKRCRAEGYDVSHIHIRYLNPMPSNLESLLKGFDQILVPEMNTGQLVDVLRAKFLVDAKGLNKVSGQPFKIREITDGIKALMGEQA
ncbi:MAG: 2-oxoglutarate ferredoxin oxidoreductase subunit alpha, partial [Gammaproteobacteria bacterium]